MPDEMLARDHFPVEIYAPHVSPVPHLGRVFITTERVIVWTRDADGRVSKLLEEPVLEPVERDRGTLRGQVSVQTAGGPIYVTRASGCGCGNPLKALAPPVCW
jgi:hypothetical protein